MPKKKEIKPEMATTTCMTAKATLPVINRLFDIKKGTFGSFFYEVNAGLSKSKIKCGAFTGFSFRPNGAAMPGDNLFNDGKSNSGAFKLTLRMESLEYFE